VVVGVRVRDHIVYFVHVADIIYLLDDYSDLFGVSVIQQWVNTLTGEIVGYRKSLRLSAVLDAAIAAGTVLETYDAT